MLYAESTGTVISGRYFKGMNRKKAVSSNCLNRQKSLRVRFCDQEDRMHFFFLSVSKNLPTDLIYLQLKATSLSVVQVRYYKSVYGESLIEKNGKGLVSRKRLGGYEHVFSEV